MVYSAAASLHRKLFDERLGGEFFIEQVPRGESVSQQRIDHGKQQRANQGSYN